MLTGTALLALCVQVADLTSLYVSFEPTGQALMERMDEAEMRWVERLRAEAGDDAAFVAAMHDGFILAMALDGRSFFTQIEACERQLDGDLPGAGGPPRVKG